MGFWCKVFHKKYWSSFYVPITKPDWETYGHALELKCHYCSVCGRIGSDGVEAY